MARFLAAVALSTLIAGCTLLQATDTASRPTREAIASFRMEGRIAVRRANERFSAAIEWRHDAQSDEIVVSGPLGQGLARLTYGGGIALLETADQKSFVAEDLEALSEKVFGTRLPVAGLGRWVLGRAALESAARRDDAGRLATFAEQGWTIEFLKYESEARDALPELMSVRREDIEVRLKIDSWSLVQ